jgi:hypothetical protein
LSDEELGYIRPGLAPDLDYSEGLVVWIHLQWFLDLSAPELGYIHPDLGQDWDYSEGLVELSRPLKSQNLWREMVFEVEFGRNDFRHHCQDYSLGRAE